MLRLRIVTLAAIALAVAPPLSAVARGEDGLSRFEALIKPHMPAGALTWGSGKGLGASGFELRDVTVTPPPEGEPGKPPKPVMPVNIERITVEDLDLDALAKDQPPGFARVHVVGLVVPAAALDDGAAALAMIGLDKLVADFTLDYRLEAQRQVMTLSKFEVDLRGLGRLELGMVLDGVTMASADEVGKSKDSASLRSASLIYEDASLLSKAVPALMSPDPQADPKLVVAAIGAGIDSVVVNPDADARAVVDAVVSFLGDYQHPKGPLRIGINPPAKATAADYEKLASVNDMIKAAGLTVSYAGTVARPVPPAAPAVAPGASPVFNARPSGADTAPTAPAAPAAGQAAVVPAPDCVRGTRVFVLSENVWSAATVIEGTAGQRCVVRIDGTSKADDIVVAANHLATWTLEGPGAAVSGCMAGSRVLVESDGAWYPAQIKPGQAAQSPGCPVHFDDFGEDDDEVVELTRVRVLE
ncbi:MAG: hypothetical protein GC191_20835 [Azospirillum sp.]|nr:hypothetical protein [Azospirillum sp.]